MPVFVCVSIRTARKVVKSWYARSVVDGQTTLCDTYAAFASGEFDHGGADIGDEYQTALHCTKV